MGAFEHFPYTNYQDFNLDWVLSAIKEVQKKIDEFDADIEQLVDEWLTEHPEYVTTVMDNSLTLPKFTDSLKLVTVKDYITPQMYGAVGDGVTDDSAAIQDALDDAQALGKPVALISNYYCDANLTVPSYVRVFGLSQNTERKPFIYAGPNVTTLFDMPGIINRFDDFNVANENVTFRNNVMFDFHGNAHNDIDSSMHGVSVGYAGKAVICRGRNLELDGCLFGHCAYGVYYDLPNQQMRGLTVKNCAFHGIGEEAALNWFENSACIYIEQDYNANLLIENCHSEQSGTFFKGHCTQALIVGNFVESYKADIVEITASPGLILGNTGTMLFLGNSFNGKAGQVAVGVNVTRPEHGMTITNTGRIAVVGNVFRTLGKEAIVCDTVNRATFMNNVFVAPGLTDSNYAFAFKLPRLTNSQIIDNVALDSGITLYDTSAFGTIKVSGNSGFTMPSSSPSVIYLRDTKLYTIGTGNGSTAITFTLPEEFYVERTGTSQLYHCYRDGNFITSAVCVTGSLEYFMLYFEKDGNGDWVPYLRKYTITGSGTVSTTLFTSQLVFYQKVND